LTFFYFASYCCTSNFYWPSLFFFSNAQNMSTLLDRLLEVAKDFEAERLQDQLAAQRRERQLEQDLKAMKRTAMYRADEISFLENQLQDARTEVESVNEVMKEIQEQNAKKSSTVEVDLKRELVCLRLEIGRLRNVNSKLTEQLEGGEKENLAVSTNSRVNVETSTNTETGFVVVSGGGQSADGVATGRVLVAAESAHLQKDASDFYRAAASGDLEALSDLLSPECVCTESYEQLVTRALAVVCASGRGSSSRRGSAAGRLFSGLGGRGGESDQDEEDEEISNDEEISLKLLEAAKLLISEGAITTTPTATVSGSGTNAAKAASAERPAPLHMAASSGNVGLVELLLAQNNPPLNQPSSTSTSSVDSSANSKETSVPMRGTPLQLAMSATRGDPPAVVKALLMAGADPKDGLAAIAAHKLSGGVDQEDERKMKEIFEDCTVMFWNSSVRAFEAYSSAKYDVALEIWGSALEYIKRGKLPISGADKARLYYNRVSCSFFFFCPTRFKKKKKKKNVCLIFFFFCLLPSFLAQARAMCHLSRRVDALEELELALELSPSYSNARILEAESYFELYAFDKCLSSIKSIPQEICETNEKIKTMHSKAVQQRDMTHYHVLGLVGPPSSEKEIKKAYRKQGMKWHPDKHQQDTDSAFRATTTFKRLNEANQVLGDTYAKMMYESELEVKMARSHYGHNGSSGGGDDIYSGGGYSSGSSRRRSYADGGEETGGHRKKMHESGAPRDRRSSAPAASNEKDSYYSQSNYADRQRRMDEEEDVLSDTDDDDDDDDDVDHVDFDDDMMRNMDAWRKADVLDSMEFDHEGLGGYSFGGYDE
jgi:tetratricopeptide (TPR) repeat protein